MGVMSIHGRRTRGSDGSSPANPRGLPPRFADGCKALAEPQRAATCYLRLRLGSKVSFTASPNARLKASAKRLVIDSFMMVACVTCSP